MVSRDRNMRSMLSLTIDTEIFHVHLFFGCYLMNLDQIYILYSLKKGRMIECGRMEDENPF